MLRRTAAGHIHLCRHRCRGARLVRGVRGRQIAGRFTVIPAAPFAYGTGAQRGQWRALIAALESLLRQHITTAAATWCALMNTSTGAAAA